MDLFEFLRKATTARLIEWKPTGGVVKWDGGTVRAYEADVKEYKVITIAHKRRESFLEYAIHIDNGRQSVVLTSNPKLIPGQKADRTELGWTVRHVQKEMEERDLINSFRQRLASMLASMLAS